MWASHAPWLPITNRPPHDPRRMPLNARVGWRLASGDRIEADGCGRLALSLQPAPENVLDLTVGGSVSSGGYLKQWKTGCVLRLLSIRSPVFLQWIGRIKF